MLRALTALAASAPLWIGTAAHAAEPLVPHRAVYDVKLNEASDRSGITEIGGRMVYEVTGSACEGWSTRFRFFQNVRSRTRRYSADQRLSSFEGGDGRSFRFANRSFFNGSEESEVRGTAERGEDGRVTVELADEEPEELAAAVFPTEHVRIILDAARAGRRFVAQDVFDGSDDGKAVIASTAVIGRPADTGPRDGEKPGALEPLEGVAAWPVTVSYFSGEADRTGERLPNYQVSFLAHENGVSRDLTMRYEDFSLDAALQELEILPLEPCSEERAKAQD